MKRTLKKAIRLQNKLAKLFEKCEPLWEKGIDVCMGNDIFISDEKLFINVAKSVGAKIQKEHIAENMFHKEYDILFFVYKNIKVINGYAGFNS